MKDKIKQLKAIRNNINVLIEILEGGFYKSDFMGKGTIGEQIFCYDEEGEDFTRVMKSIIKEHGDEPCPFSPNNLF